MLAVLAEIIIGGSVVTLQPTERVGALAEVVFQNVQTNGPDDTGHYGLEMDGLAVSVGFTWNDGGSDDTITITPPDGIACDPADCTLTVQEHTTGTLYLFEFFGF